MAQMTTQMESTPGAASPQTTDATQLNQVAAKTGADTREKRHEIKVFKKSSLSGKVTVYLGKRDFVDHIAYVDPIDGVVLIDRDHVKNKRVFVHVLAAFSYGRDDLDVLGLAFRKELYLVSDQIYPDPNARHNSKGCPYFIEELSSAGQTGCETASSKAANSNHEQNLAPPQTQPKRLTRLQERLVKKLGPNAFPFFFELPPLVCPASVTLQPGPGDSGKPCGVDYELKVYVMDTDERPTKRDTIRLAIRKIMYAPSRGHTEQPMVEVSKDFMMSPNKLNLEVSLDKDLYYHGESIAVNVHVSNNSNRTVKKVRVAVRQYADICLFSTAQYKCTVAEIESEEGCPVGPGSTLSKVYYVCPLLVFNKDKRGLALDGQLKHEDTNLASSTLLNESSQKENLGIVVQYKVRVKLSLGTLGGEITAELPFTLMHPKPEGEDDLLISKSSPIGISGFHRRGSSRNPLEMIFSSTTACRCHLRDHEDDESEREKGEGDDNERNRTDKAKLDEQNLIQLDDDSELVFEDFARMQLDQSDMYNSCQMNNEDEQQELDCFRRSSGGACGQLGASDEPNELIRSDHLQAISITANNNQTRELNPSDSPDNKPPQRGSDLTS